MSKGEGLRQFAKLVAEGRAVGRTGDEIFDQIARDDELWRQIADDLVGVLEKELESYAEESGLSSDVAQDLAWKLVERWIAGKGFSGD